MPKTSSRCHTALTSKIPVIPHLMLIAFCMVWAATAPAQQEVTAAPQATFSQPVVPRLVNFSGKAADSQGKPISGIAGITFAIYKDQYQGAPLWLETQNVQADAKGNYTVQLGATKPNGLPLDLFSSGDARWLGVSVNGGIEQPRVLLLSVPYALKAADAETIGGLPPSAFVLANKAQSTATGIETAPGAPTAKNAPLALNPAVTGKGTFDFVPMWDSTSDIVNSLIFQKSSQVGINTITPAATLDVNGKSDVRDTLTLFPKGTDSTLAVNGTAFKVDQTGKMTFIPGQTFPGAGTITGISTASGSGLSGGGTSGPLNLKVPSAGIANTMLQHSNITLNANSAGGLTTPGSMTLGGTSTIGLKTCAANQVLEYNGTAWNCSSAGTGTITGVTAGTDLTGSGTSGNVTLNLDTSATDARYAQLSAPSNIFTGAIVAGGNIVSRSGVSAVNVTASSNSVINGQAAILGKNYAGQTLTGEIYAVAGVSGPTGTTGVLGRSDGASNTGSFYDNASTSSGVWADTGDTTSGNRQGVLATADEANAVLAVNNGRFYATMQLINQQTSGSAANVFTTRGTISPGVFGFCNIDTLGGLTCSGPVNAGTNSPNVPFAGPGLLVANTDATATIIAQSWTTGSGFIFAGKDHSGSIVSLVDNAGNIFANGKVTANAGFNGQCLQGNLFDTSPTNSCNMDLAEAYASAQATEPGDLVSLVPGAEATVRKSTGRYEALLLGVVSSNPGLVFDNGQTHLAGNNSQLITKDKTVIALAGRVPVKISIENGPIRVGDPLTSSSKSGVAMRARFAGKIIGYALEPANKPGKVLSFIQPGYNAAPEMQRLQRENLALRKQLKDLVSQVQIIRTELDRTPLRADLHTATTTPARPKN
jgi:hypothetical protein